MDVKVCSRLNELVSKESACHAFPIPYNVSVVQGYSLTDGNGLMVIEL